MAAWHAGEGWTKRFDRRVCEMVRADGTRVSLSTGDWLKIGISNAIAVGVTIVTLWTKTAVVEVEIAHLKQAIAKLEQKLESR
jgi:hypothetical protein